VSLLLNTPLASKHSTPIGTGFEQPQWCVARTCLLDSCDYDLRWADVDRRNKRAMDGASLGDLEKPGALIRR